jgi:hypothetical protein
VLVVTSGVSDEPFRIPIRQNPRGGGVGLAHRMAIVGLKVGSVRSIDQEQ